MAKLIYGAIMSLDGYIEDADGRFDWAVPDEEAHAFINERQRGVGTFLYGRRMYETMAAWETMDLDGQPEVMRDFAEIWRAADKVVYSTTLKKTNTARTRLERSFDAGAVRQMKSEASQDISIAGPTVAANAFESGLVDACELYVAPVTVGAGKKALPDGRRLTFALEDERRLDGGMMYLRYRIQP